MTLPIPFIDLQSQYRALKDEIGTRMQRVLDHGQYIMGPEVAELEAQLAARTGAKHCITVSSGTEALLISLMALQLKPGDEVITTPFTFAATAETIVLLGGVPVFADIEPDTCNLDAALIEAKITPRTRAIMPVGLYGQVADMDAINAVAARHGLAVIEDAAQSFGARYWGGATPPGAGAALPPPGTTWAASLATGSGAAHQGHGPAGARPGGAPARQSGHLSTLGCTSFFPSKPLGCYGDGGAIFTSDDALAQACREIRVHGQSERYTHTRVGVGGRMDTLQCAVVLAKLQRFDWELARRRELGARYAQLLAGVPGVRLLAVRADRDCVWAQYTVFVQGRAQVQAALQAQGIPTAVHYPRPLHHQPAYEAFCCPECCPHSVHAASQVMSLPMSADLSDAQQDRIVAALVQAVAGSAMHSTPPAVAV